MTMTETQVDAEAAQVDQRLVDFVRAGYAGASLHFSVRPANLATFRECLWAIGGYGNFNAGTVSDALADVLAYCSDVTVGREHKPVIYLAIPFHTGQMFSAREARVQPQSEPIFEHGREELAARVMAAGRGALADDVRVELTVPDLPPALANRVYRVRLAWTN